MAARGNEQRFFSVNVDVAESELEGRDAEEVINEIESLFEETYKKLLQDFE